MKRRGGLVFFVLLLLAVALIGAYGVYWKIVHDRALALLNEQIADWRAQGYVVEWRSMTTGGFPLAVEATLLDIRVTPPPGQEPWVWTGERLRVGLEPWALDRILLTPEGRQTAETREWGVVDAEAELFTVGVAADALGVRTIDIEGKTAFAVRRADGATVAAAETLSLHAERWAADALSYSVLGVVDEPEWEGAGAAPPQRLELDADVAALTVLTASGALDEPTLRAWAQAGGRVAVRSLRADWGDSAAGAQGDLGLEESGQWSGRVEVDAREPALAFQHLASLGAVDPQAARQAGAVADAVAQGPDRTARLSLEIRSGEVYVLGLKLGEVDPAF